MSWTLDCTPANDGIAIGKAYKLDTLSEDTIKDKSVSDEAIKMDLDTAIHLSKIDIIKLRNFTEENIGTKEAAIFDVHLMILEDAHFLDDIQSRISDDVNVVQAIIESRNHFIDNFSNNHLGSNKDQSIDIYDVTNRLIGHLLEIPKKDIATIDEPVVIVAQDLTPSEIAQFNTEYTKGVITLSGSPESHTAIMAKSINIPYMICSESVIEEIVDDSELILDGYEGIVIVEPTLEEVQAFQKELKIHEEKLEKLKSFKDKPTISEDGTEFQLLATVNSSFAFDSIRNFGAEGIGLFRTEMMFMSRDSLPTEEDQVKIYNEVLSTYGDEKPTTIRLLDVGGDKYLPYLEHADEENPFLGMRGARFLLQHDGILSTQLRALLRASTSGQLQILVPFISTLQEFSDIKRVFESVKMDLRENKIPFDEEVPLGVMIEVPSAVLIANDLASEADFLSIGTNDLVQHLFAVDRTNLEVNYLYDTLHPAVFRAIEIVVEAAQQHDRDITICGEISSVKEALKLLIGLGIRNFSVNSEDIFSIRQFISELTAVDMKKFATLAKDMHSSDNIKLISKDY